MSPDWTAAFDQLSADNQVLSDKLAAAEFKVSELLTENISITKHKDRYIAANKKQKTVNSELRTKLAAAEMLLEAAKHQARGLCTENRELCTENMELKIKYTEILKEGISMFARATETINRLGTENKVLKDD